MVVAYATATTDLPDMTASANGITFQRYIATAGSAAAHRLAFWVSDQLVRSGPAAMTVTADYTGDATTGCNMSVMRVAGMSRSGAAAVRQTIGADNNLGTGAALTLTFGAASIAGNVLIIGAGNNSNPAGLTPPTSFVEAHDVGHATPASGVQTSYRDSSAGQTTITYGSTSATVGTGAALELDTSVLPRPNIAIVPNAAMVRAGTR